MIRLQDTSYTVGYEINDITTIEDLIEDIGESVKRRLAPEIKHKPLKCNITIVYSSIIEEYLNGNTKSESLGRTGEQSGD